MVAPDPKIQYPLHLPTYTAGVQVPYGAFSDNCLKRANGSCFPSKKTMRVYNPPLTAQKWSLVFPRDPVPPPVNSMFGKWSQILSPKNVI